jgi:hypothetical protein
MKALATRLESLVDECGRRCPSGDLEGSIPHKIAARSVPDALSHFDPGAKAVRFWGGLWCRGKTRFGAPRLRSQL